MEQHLGRLQRIEKLCSELDEQVDTAQELKKRLQEIRREAQRLVVDLSRSRESA